MAILVTGGAGYVGSHIVRLLHERGRDVIVLDDLRTGHASAVADRPLVRGSIDDGAALAQAHAQLPFDAVIHMAACCLVGESMTEPAAYYENNLVAPLGMLRHLRALGVRRIVFSSSAAVYGAPRESPIPEEHPCLPTNPYGETKLAFERALAWQARAGGIEATCLRYFNAAGAHPSGELGEDHEPESHLIPCVLRAGSGDGEPVRIHGDGFPTPDGTCVRDFVHVVDLAEAHVLALDALASGAPGDVFNLGTGTGHSVRQVVEAAGRVVGQPIPAEVGPARPGDPPTLVASPRRAAEKLGWQPRIRSLQAILETAWRWHRDHPAGYGDAP